MSVRSSAVSRRTSIATREVEVVETSVFDFPDLPVDVRSNEEMVQRSLLRAKKGVKEKRCGVSPAHSCRVVSCRVVSCRVVSCRVVSCRVVSCRVVSCRNPSLLTVCAICGLWSVNAVGDRLVRVCLPLALYLLAPCHHLPWRWTQKPLRRSPRLIPTTSTWELSRVSVRDALWSDEGRARCGDVQRRGVAAVH